MSTVTVVAAVEASNTPPRVRLDVTDTGSSPSIFSTTVVRRNPDGTLVPVRTQDGNPLQLTTSGTTRVGVLYDYEAPLAAPVSYSTLETPGSVTGAVTVPASQVWLIHPGVPGLSMPVELRTGSWAEETFAVKQGVFYPMGRTTPVVVTDGTRKASESSITVAIETPSALAAIRNLIADGGVLMLNPPAQLGYGVDPCYIAVGDVRISRLTDIGSYANRDVVLPYVVVSRPLGGSQSQRTLDTLSSFASLDAIGTAYSSLNAVLAGP